MAETDIDKTQISNMNSSVSDIEVAPQSLDSPTNQKENPYVNDEWTQQLGYYNDIPEVMAVVDAKARWTLGKGFVADPETTMLLDTIKGITKDTFNTILENMVRIYQIGGDAFAEIITDDEGFLINLKPLSPKNMRIVANQKGIIIRYEQIDKSDPNNIKVIGKPIIPEKMLHLMRNRLGDQFHGTSMLKALADIINSRNEALKLQRKIMRRYAVPTIIWKLDTDIESEITAFKAKAELVSDRGDNYFIPKGAADHELLAVPPNATLNTITWIKELNNYFFQAAGCPQIIVGNASEFTDASAKISYLAWQQTIEEEQLYIEEAILSQLNLVIDLVFPASLEGELLSDKAKDVQTGAAKPSDLIAGRGT